jgi:hypothetical protein
MTALAIDSHVHLHSAAGAMEALHTARDRLTRNGRMGVVMLAERQGFDVLNAIRDNLIATREPESFWLDKDRTLLILAGSQIISSEKLEILALATTARLPDGAPAEKIIADMIAADAIVVLPWGVGKWLGKRGALVDRLISAARPGTLLLGDNGGRPGFWPVQQFKSGLHVLAGSDALPLPGWPGGVAKLASLIDVDLSPDTPAASLKRALRDPETSLGRMGQLASPIRFVLDQTRLRLHGGRAVP